MGRTKHGMSGTRLWGIWRQMRRRCDYPKDNKYKDYGGRGIKVCEEWHNIENFEKWVEENPHSKGLTLDRIDANGNYEPSNCRWATMKTQDNNRRNTIYIEYNGETHTISEWSETTGISRSTLNNRYCRGWRGDKLFSPKLKHIGRHIEVEGGKKKWVG